MSNTWGALSWNVGSWGTGGDQTFAVSGISASFSIGSQSVTGEINSGCGRQEWGNSAWGEAFSVSATGQSITSTIGSTTAFTDFTAVVSGIQSSFSIANIAIQIDGNIFVTAAEDQLDFTIGSS